ncbi:reverse transcriptase domain-containing protein, partial [Tanacetum coccineum]
MRTSMERATTIPTEMVKKHPFTEKLKRNHFEIRQICFIWFKRTRSRFFENEIPHLILIVQKDYLTLRVRNVPNDCVITKQTIASRTNTTSRESVSKTDERIDKLPDQLSTLVEIVSMKVITPAPIKAVEETWVTCGGAILVIIQNHAITSRYSSGNTILNPKGVERETEETMDKEQSNFQGSTAQIPPPVTPIPTPEPDVPKNLPKPNIPYPSRRNDQKSRDKASNQMEKIFQIIQDLRFDISFADALLLMPRFAPTIKSLLMNKEKLLELAKIPLNENCSAMLLKKLPEKLGDPGKFLIPCNFPGMDVCHALADLGASINLMPLSFWKKLFPQPPPPNYTNSDDFRVADRLITHPKGLAEDVFVKVGKFHFPTNFVVVDFEADPRVPLILGGSVLRISLHQRTPEDDDDEKEKQEVKNLAEPTVKRQTRITPYLKNFKVTQKETIFHSSKTPQVSSVFAITSTLPTIEPKDSLIMGDEHLSIFCVEEIVPIPRESEDTFDNNKGCDLTFSNLLLGSKDNNNSILKEDVQEENFQVYSNPLFEFDDNYNFSDVNPLFDKVLEDIECKDSYDSNLDESTFLVTPLSDSKKDECLAPGNDIEFLLHHDPSTPMKSIASILEGFIDEPPFKENDDLFDLECKTNDWKRILYDAQIDEAECFDPGGDNDEIDAFLAIEVPTYIEEGYYDSEGDVLYLESLLSDDTTHNLSPKVFFDHEPQHIKNESDHDTFSPKSDPLYHEFAGESITIPPRIVREHEDYISRMWLLCGNSSSRSPENFHTIIESLPTSTTLIEDSDSNREEIDIFSGPDDSIPPGIESDFDSEEDIIDNLLNDDPIPEYERLTFDIEPDVPMIINDDELNEDECFDPGGGEINVEVDNSFTFVIQTFLPYLTYPEVSPLLSSTENEDTIFDP